MCRLNETGIKKRNNRLKIEIKTGGKNLKYEEKRKKKKEKRKKKTPALQ